ncbi:DciA family protein [Streptomyces griseofuscus]|uniref:DciA family protein n=1 Tax=Streptomyces griseofuscus TaxID=146922 RepID=UPI0036AE89ED
MSQQPSGIDLARAALAAARASANTRPAQPQKKTRSPRPVSSRRAGDPMGLGLAIDRMMTDRGWEPPEPGGSILDQWPAIAPELAGKVTAVRFEHDTGTLHLQPASAAYATQLRLFQTQILRRIHEKTGDRAVRGLRILPPGAGPAGTHSLAEEPPAPAVVEAPVKTWETASTGYREALAAVLEHRPEPQHTDPYIAVALARQEAALRANRQPEPAVELDTTRRVDRSEVVRRAALARKRQEQAGRTEPRRAFDVA